MDLSCNSIDYLNSVSTYSDWRTTVMLEVSWNQFRDSIHTFLKGLIISFSPKHIQVNDHSSLLVKLWERIKSDIFWQCTGVPAQGDLASLSFEGLWVFKLTQVWELIAEPWLFLWFKLDFCSLDLELLHLYKSSKNLVGFLSSSSNPPCGQWQAFARDWVVLEAKICSHQLS